MGLQYGIYKADGRELQMIALKFQDASESGKKEGQPLRKFSRARG